MPMDDKHRKEKIERTIFVLGIFAASVIGFVINVFTSVYYEVFLTGAKRLSDYNQTALIIPILILFLSVAFLSFLVYDYQNELNLNRSLLKRFFDYYDNVFWLNQLTKKIGRGLIISIKWLFAFAIGLALYQTTGLTAVSIWIGIIVLWLSIKFIYNKKHVLFVRFHKKF